MVTKYTSGNLSHISMAFFTVFFIDLILFYFLLFCFAMWSFNPALLKSRNRIRLV